jgi:hypothetical protein
VSSPEFSADKFEHVSADVQRLMEALAEAACREFLSAGLPAVVMPGTEPVAGVNIEIDTGADEAGGVFATWSPSEALDLAAADAVAHGRHDDPSIKHSGAICKAMADAMLVILVSSGFVARVGENEYMPFSIEILAERPQ